MQWKDNRIEPFHLICCKLKLCIIIVLPYLSTFQKFWEVWWNSFELQFYAGEKGQRATFLCWWRRSSCRRRCKSFTQKVSSLVMDFWIGLRFSAIWVVSTKYHRCKYLQIMLLRHLQTYVIVECVQRTSILLSMPQSTPLKPILQILVIVLGRSGLRAKQILDGSRHCRIGCCHPAVHALDQHDKAVVDT